MPCYCGCNPCCRPVCYPRPVFPTESILTGRVVGMEGPVENVIINYTVNGSAASTTTDANGRYSITAPKGAVVVITPEPGLGVTATPASRTVGVCDNRSDLDFVLTVV